MPVINENMTTLIPNATMQKKYINGIHKGYNVTPNEGYVLHDTQYDTVRFENQIDENTGETVQVEVPVLGYHTMTVTCSASYAFTPIQMQDEAGNTVTAYGDRKFYCKPIGDVPADQIFGVNEPEHEVQ
jgi:hypothetical protein